MTPSEHMAISCLWHLWCCDNAVAGYEQPEPKGWWEIGKEV